MSDRMKVDADLQFVQGVLDSGGQDLKKCYQCSTCTVACPLTPEGAPFPRKEMISAQWGIKQKLIGSMDPWLCFHCNDCSDQCPRGAKPGDVMAAVRNMSIKHFATPSIVGSLTASLSGVLLLLLLPMAIIAAVVYGVNVGSGFKFLDSNETIVFSKMLSVTAIDIIFLTTVAFSLLCAYRSLRKFVLCLQRNYPRSEDGESLSEAIKGTIADILTHKQFKECGVNRSRNLAHMLTFYGFVGLAITTACVVPIHYGHVFGLWDLDTPLPFFHPVKILGNVSAASACIGILWIFGRRLTNPAVGASVSFDWTFISIVALIVATGILAQVTRVSDLNPLAYVVYYCHLVLIFFLFAYAPNSKMAHMFYRTAALIYARYSGRSKSIGTYRLEDKSEAVS